MPELKHNFTGGKMNKDLDERLVPNGQYRDALNIEVSSSEGSDVGTVQNILGNDRVESIVGEGFVCVGSIADEKTNKLYWFISKYSKDVILEYDIDNDVASPVLVDTKAGTQKAVLKFFGNIITGINVIDNLLLWTDDKGEPKKINITKCKAGTVDFNTHTKLSFSNNSFHGIAAEYVWPYKMPNFDSSDGIDPTFVNDQNPNFGASEEQHPPLKSLEERITIGRYISFERKRLAAMLGIEFNSLIDNYGQIKDANNFAIDTSSSYDAPGNINATPTGSLIPGEGYCFRGRHYRDGELLGVKDFKAFDNINGTHLRLHDGTSTFNSTPTQTHTDTDFIVGDVLFGVDVKLDIEEKHITVIKPKPLKAPSVKINYKEITDVTSKKPNLFEEKLPRFSYRYKYSDGEFSAFAPFTDPVFNPQYTANTTKSNDGSVLYSKDTAYDIKEHHNKAMVNAIHSVDLMDFITINTPEDVVEVDILYKQEDSPVIYSIGTVKHTDFDWHASVLNSETKNTLSYGVSRYDSSNFNIDTLPWMPAADGSYNSGRYQVTTENIYAALPANQLLRPWDNVPRKALAQEVSGSRVVYGNYIQNYTIGSKPKVFVEYDNRKQTLASFDTKGLPSIKSQRNYQLGVVYCDEFGRETPVFTSNSGAINIPWADSSGSKNASKSGQLIASVANNLPDWVDSIKFFVKENSGEYYNLAMERAWTGKSTYELDNSEGHLWISFPSSDRNKISEDDYIILKKKIGTGEDQVNFENKFKVVGIENEAPDAIKYELVNLGVINGGILTQDDGVRAKLFNWPNQRPDKQQDTIVISHSTWMSYSAFRVDLMPGVAHEDVFEVTDLYLSWSRIASDGLTTSSTKYKVVGGWKGSSGYVLKLNRKITKKDADIAHKNGKSSVSETDLNSGLHFQVERRQLKEQENFSGQFFVKISKNQISSIIEKGKEISNLDKFQVSAKQSVFYFKDDTNSVTGSSQHVFKGGAPYGLTNFFGDSTQHNTAASNIQTAGGGNINQNALGDTARLTDHHTMWKNILSTLTGKSRWFVDAMHMASGQSDESDHAKYNCVTWSGYTPSDHAASFNWLTNRTCAWTYPPVKKWWTEISENEVELQERRYSGFAGAIVAATAAGGAPILFAQSPSQLVTTSKLFDKNQDWTIVDPVTEETEGVQIDGWVGGIQRVRRRTLVGSEFDNHINGLEGIVTTNEYHSNGPRRWFSGMNGTGHNNGRNTRTYADNDNDTGRHFMHLSFFAPGKDLHDNESWHLNTPTLYGEDSWMDNLQGIWGGGVFTGIVPNQKFGSSLDAEEKHFHLAMEGNYADGEEEEHKVYSTPPGPGIGYGYDISKNYRELHERQWDPTFNSDGDDNNEIRDFIRNLYPGSKFRFHHTAPSTTASQSAIIDDEVYTIKKVQTKKLYNHTSWRTTYNTYYDGSYGGPTTAGYFPSNSEVEEEYRSVEQMAMIWLNNVNANGVHSSGVSNSPATAYGNNSLEDFKKKIVDFGAAHNRRLCYIIELDKNPCDSGGTLGNPFNQNSSNGILSMSGGAASDQFTDIEFLDPVQDILLNDLNKFPAIWELSPKKQDVDLDIYYEASNNIPVRINRHTNDLFAPKGCLVEMINPPFVGDSGDVHLIEWKDNVAVLEPGFVRGDGENEIDYTNVKFKFIRSDGSYTVAQADLQQLTTSLDGYKTDFNFKIEIGNKIEAGLSWYNCFSFGNGLESNRIRDDFNEMFIANGVKASTTVQETYEEERRPYGLIYSGLYNSNSGVNDLNQFVMAEKITKDLNPIYGSIQRLFSRNTDLVSFCEDKVVKILANKDAVFNADGNAQLTANQNVLGQTVPFVGEYGISKNPESFASESYRAYFADKQRGAVLRLSKDGLTPISKAGMHDWFRDNLSKHNSIIGTYDSYKENYNLTLSNTYSENIIFNTLFQLGAESQRFDASVLSITQSLTGSQYRHSHVSKDIGTDNLEYDQGVDSRFKTDITVVNHPAIPKGYFQAEIPAAPTAQIAAEYLINVDPEIPYEAGLFYQKYFSSTAPANYSGAIPSYANANYAPEPADFDDGWLYDPRFTTVTDDIWGPYDQNATSNRTALADPQASSDIERYVKEHNGSVVKVEEQDVNSHYNYAHPWGNIAITGNQYNEWEPTAGSHTGITNNTPHTEKACIYNVGSFWPYGGNNVHTSTNQPNMRCVSGTITRDSATKEIVFDRCHRDSYILCKRLGEYDASDIDPSTGVQYASSKFNNKTGESGGVGSLTDAIQASQNYQYGSALGKSRHSDMYNGDELHVQVKIRAYMSWTDGYPTNGNWREQYGYNIIAPKISIKDGLTGSTLPADILVANPSIKGTSGSYNPYEEFHSWPGLLSSADWNEWTGPIVSLSNDSASISSANEGGYLLNSTQTTVTAPSNNYRSISGTRNNGDISNIQEYINGGSFTFPSTKYLYHGTHTPQSQTTSTFKGGFSDQDPHTWPYRLNTDGSYEMVIGFSLKFRDPAQQDSSGVYTGGGAGIIPVRVAQALQIKIRNTKSTNNVKGDEVYPGGLSERPMENQFWKIVDIKMQKGFCAMSDNVDYDPGYAGDEVYDDLSTSGTEAFTLTQLQSSFSGMGTFDPTLNNGGGGYVLNQAAIDIHNSQYANAVYATNNIPPADVPAFVEVIRSNENWSLGIQSIAPAGTLIMTGGNAGQWYWAQESDQFGNERGKIPMTADKIDPITGATGATVTWYEPGTLSTGDGPTGLVAQENSYGNNATSGAFTKTIIDADNQQCFAPSLPNKGLVGSDGFFDVNSGYTTPSATYTVSNPWWRVSTNDTIGGGYGISYDITTNPMQDGEWYLVDVELDSTKHPDVLMSPSNGGSTALFDTMGRIAIKGVGDNALAPLYNLAQLGGFGEIGGNGSTDNHAMCLPHWRTEYGGDMWVLRTVFKATSNSWKFTTAWSDSDITKLNIRLYNMHASSMFGEAYISKIRYKKITYTNNTGTSNWLRGVDPNGANTDEHIQYNALTELKLYYNSNSLCFDDVLPQDNYLGSTSGPYESYWTKSLGGALLNAGTGWILKFTVLSNPYTLKTFTDNTGSSLAFFATGENNVGASLGQFTGIIGQNIQDEGVYEVRFTMDGINNGWEILKDGIEYNGSNDIDEYAASGALTANTNMAFSNTVGFVNLSPSIPLSCSVSEIFITQLETIFSGGQAGSWAFDGFSATSDQFITWDKYWDSTGTTLVPDGRLQFTDCPTFDPSFGNGNVIICANQYIDKVINRYEKYEISFNFRMEEQHPDPNVPTMVDGQGLFHMYYFNSEGYGFRINDIGNEAFNTILNNGTSAGAYPNYNKEAIYDDSGVFLWWRVTKIVGIGDGSVFNPLTGNGNLIHDSNGDIVQGTEEHAYSEFVELGSEALRDTLVVRMDNTGNQPLTGWIDDISMRRAYQIETIDPDGIPDSGDEYQAYPETTLTFSEETNGWISFKSFVPESGLSLSKKYFTIKDGFLHRHYVPLKYNTVSSVWEGCVIEEADNYNHFYNHLGSDAYDSSLIKFVMNAEPSVVKNFNTLNYEGSQAFVTNPGVVALTDTTLITQQNSLAWALNDYANNIYPNIEGWKCVDIKTDLSSGDLLEFIKKEGKWFGYIRGKEEGGVLDTSRFSVQGIGTVSSIETI